MFGDWVLRKDAESGKMQGILIRIFLFCFVNGYLSLITEFHWPGHMYLVVLACSHVNPCHSTYTALFTLHPQAGYQAGLKLAWLNPPNACGFNLKWLGNRLEGVV